MLVFDGEEELDLTLGSDLELDLLGSLELTFNELDESELEEVELHEPELELKLELNAEGGSHAGHPAAHTHRTASVCALPRETSSAVGFRMILLWRLPGFPPPYSGCESGKRWPLWGRTPSKH